MKRTQRAVLTGVLVLGMLGVAYGQDIVVYQDRVAKKDLEYRGTIEDEGPGGIKIKVKEGKDMVVKTVPAGVITRVTYGSKEVAAIDYRKPFGKEDRARSETNLKKRGEFLADALSGYLDLDQKLGSNPRAKRYFQFKMAEVAVLQAQTDPTRVDAAIKALSDFKTAHPGGWQIMPALKMLARLQEEAGKTDDARKAYEELAELPDVPLQLKQESNLLVGRLLLRAGKYPDAEKRLQKLVGAISRDDAQAPFVRAYLAESQLGQDKLASVQKDLTEVIGASTDARLRGLAYNLLGDFYRKKGQPEEAFWSYLRVDAVYNEDAEEQAKAMYHLAGLFDSYKKNPVRRREYLEALMNQRYAGTSYQKLAAKEVKKGDE